MATKKIIVTGGSGLLGRSVVACLRDTHLSKRTFEIQRWALNRVGEKLDKKVDIANKEEVDKAVDEFEPDAIVHCAAIRSPDLVNNRRDLAHAINVLGSQNVAEAAARHNAKLIYISTDFVFDGTNPPYSESAEPNPLNDYGKQKLVGEHASFENCSGAVVLRVPLLYSPVEYLGEGPVDVLLKAVLDRSKPAEMSDYELRYPTHVDDVAAVIRLLLETHFDANESGQPTPIRGIYHWSADEEMTKYDIAVLMAKVFSLPADHLVANPGPPPPGATQRPYNSKLSCQRLLELGAKNKFSNFAEGVRNILPHISELRM